MGVNHAEAFLRANRLWGTTAGRQINTSLTFPASQSLPFARLYLDVYGGTNAYKAQVAVTVNGTALPTISIGGNTDTNPTFDVTQNCVYGSSIGQYQVAFAGVADLLKKDGSANNITVLVTKTSGNFDGRIVDLSLVGVRQDASIDQSLDYFLAEGDGYMRKPPADPYYGNAPAQRTVSFSGVNTSNVTSASYTTLYTHGNAGEADRLFFNGTQMGGNDLAVAQYGQYGPDIVTFDVAGHLATNTTATYDVNSLSSSFLGETSLLAKIGLLQVTHPVPEPASLGLLAMAGLGWLVRRSGPARC
jgi:hypothetical protein